MPSLPPNDKSGRMQIIVNMEVGSKVIICSGREGEGGDGGRLI